MSINETPVRKSGVSHSRIQNLWGGLRHGFRRRMLGRKLGPAIGGGSSETNNVTNAPSTNSIGLSNLGAGAELYAQLKCELETIANFQRNATGAFGHRLDQLVEIARESVGRDCPRDCSAFDQIISTRYCRKMAGKFGFAGRIC